MAAATPKLLISIAVIMGAIYGADQFLAKLEQRELDAEARHRADEGRHLVESGRAAEAIEAFRRAHVLDRDNEAYTLGLADAYLASHQPERAAEILSDALDEDSNDGQANLLMARAMNEEQRFPSADSYYHRAIYGSWRTGADIERVKARLELVHWLAQRGEAKELLAELIPLEAFAKSDDRIARALPGLYLQAGSPSRAIDAYRELVEARPDDGSAYAGLGQVELEAGNFHSARQALEKAVALKPDDDGLRRDAEVAQLAMELDPTSRRLSSSEKLERSNRILKLAVDTYSACGGGQTDSPLFQTARKLAAEKTGASTNEASEERLDFAQRIWNSRPESCSVAAGQEKLLSVLVHKISQ